MRARVLTAVALLLGGCSGSKVTEIVVSIASDLAPADRVLVGRKMALYAILAENMDHHTGRLIEYLKSIGEYDNTIFIFFSDNGAEGNDVAHTVSGTPGTRDFLFYAANYSQTHPNAWGLPGSNVTYGPGWAQLSMTPFRDHKGMSAEERAVSFHLKTLGWRAAIVVT